MASRGVLASAQGNGDVDGLAVSMPPTSGAQIAEEATMTTRPNASNGVFTTSRMLSVTNIVVS